MLSLSAGLAAATQTTILGRFGQRIGSLPATAFCSVITVVCAFGCLLILGQSPAAVVAGLHAPPWMLVGGLIGSFYLFSVTVAAPRIGTTTTLSFVIMGQLATGALIDQFGLFGVDKIELTWLRLLGALLLLAGASLTLRR